MQRHTQHLRNIKGQCSLEHIEKRFYSAWRTTERDAEPLVAPTSMWQQCEQTYVTILCWLVVGMCFALLAIYSSVPVVLRVLPVLAVSVTPAHACFCVRRHVTVVRGHVASYTLQFKLLLPSSVLCKTETAIGPSKNISK